MTAYDTITRTAAAAGTWTIGDQAVSRLGFGAMRLTGMPWDERPRDRGASIAVVRRAVELGVNHIDTAAFYFVATRSANEIIGAALTPFPDDVLIATKVGPSRGRSSAFEFEPYARPAQLREQVEENIRQLGVDALGLVNLRWGSGLEKEVGSVADHVGALLELRDAGLLRSIGVSNVSADQLAEANSIAPIASVQNRYGLTERADNEVLALARAHGVAFVPFFSMGSAVPHAVPGGAADVTGASVVADIAAAHGATPTQIRLAWTLHQGENVLAIPGTGDIRHLEENIAAGSIRLTDGDLAALDAIAPPA
ncbi:aldo/keto reductase [Microbacterium karelineae]|uniref:aldo/keto reductase n=1 Tax=Microbacterium karelineae TaxID=2654283 RepID=UPI0012EA95F1|nr:aldo/keto reductase [Microbacterium karelineae]